MKDHLLMFLNLNVLRNHSNNKLPFHSFYLPLYFIASNCHGNIHFHVNIEELSMFNLKILILVRVITFSLYLYSSKSPLDNLKKILHVLHNQFQKCH